MSKKEPTLTNGSIDWDLETAVSGNNLAPIGRGLDDFEKGIDIGNKGEKGRDVLAHIFYDNSTDSYFLRDYDPNRVELDQHKTEDYSRRYGDETVKLLHKAKINFDGTEYRFTEREDLGAKLSRIVGMI